MNSIEGGVLGLIQGLTEFIPVSSSGHLVIGQYFFSGASDHLFLEFINIGTVLALLIYFRIRIITLLKNVFFEHNYRLARNILLAALPAGIVGLLLSDFIDSNAFFGNVWVVAVTLFVVGVLMIVLEKLPKKSEVEDGEKLGWQRALAVGCTQVMALIPGVSRSGSTIIAGRLMGLKPAAAAEYSFLISIPIMLGVTAKIFMKASDRTYFFAHWEVLLISNAIALIAGLLAVGFLMRYLSKHGLAVFGWYRIVLSLVLVAILLIQ
jgi:undecaprenyl-diphosphatase